MTPEKEAVLEALLLLIVLFAAFGFGYFTAVVFR